jgi:hypothetical protein
LNQIPADTWSQIIQIVLSAVIVSPAALGLKKLWKIEEEKIMLGVVILGSFVPAVILYLQSNAQLAPSIVAVQAGLIFASTQPIYLYFLKPLTRALGAWFSDQLTQAAALNDVKTAAVPETGLAIGNK